VPSALDAAGRGSTFVVAMETDLYLELTDGGVLRWRRCAHCGETLGNDAARARGFDPPCEGWARTDPQAARRLRATRIAHDRASLRAVSPFA
jgi:hypothetical protein